MSNFSRKLIAWLSIGSTYTYLTALRLEEKKKSENLDLLIKLQYKKYNENPK